jgi:hypothetical protein
MPGGKAPIIGAIGWPKRLPDNVELLQLGKWSPIRGHLQPSSEELARLDQQVREAVGRYFGFKSGTLLLTQTERDKRIAQALKIGTPEALQALDVNSRAIVYRRLSRRDSSYVPRGRRWRDPLLVDLVNELATIWKALTGRSPRTIDPDGGEYPFYDWLADLFAICHKDDKAPSRGTIIDILAQPKPKKSGD